MVDEQDFTDPSGAGNFLHRYNQMRSAQSSSSPTSSSEPSTPTTSNPSPPPPPSPTSLRSKPIPINRSDAAKHVWGSVFHPLGRSPKSAARYDLSRGQESKPGHSASEVHSKGSGMSLDDRQID